MTSSGSSSGQSLRIHLARGALGAVCLAVIAALPFAEAPIAASMAAAGLFALALFAWRGCPMCWAADLLHFAKRATLFRGDTK